MLPALLALLLLALFSAPMRAGDLALVPNIGWIMTLVVAFIYPPSWPRWFAFMLGLLQDVLFSTPLGAQALLTLLLLQLVSAQARRQSFQRFRVRWLEAAGDVGAGTALFFKGGELHLRVFQIFDDSIKRVIF